MNVASVLKMGPRQFANRSDMGQKTKREESRMTPKFLS